MTKINKISYSENQIKALSLNKENMLVSAGAGSGKTAVLVERVTRIIREKNVPLDRILVLTFTNDGANEFKTRIKNSLLKDPLQAHKAYAIDNADITTIDAFSLKIVKKYGYLLNLDPSIINLDEQIEDVLFQRSFDEVMSKHYETPSATFTRFARHFLIKDDTNLVKMIKNFHRESKLSLDPEKFVTTFINKTYSEARFQEHIAELNGLIITKLHSIASNVKKLRDENHVERYEPFLEAFGHVLTFDDLILEEALFKAPRAPNNWAKHFPDDQIPISEIKADFKFLAKCRGLLTMEAMTRDFGALKKYAAFLVSIYKETIAAVNLFKKQKNAFTFSDIARTAFELVSLSAVKAELKAQYEYILIDEYQDTSDIQEAMIQQIATNNVYMVGDIKQSIYAFRNANSEIFRTKYAHYAKKDGGVLVDLNDNYRSRSEVLASINIMLSELMSDEIGGANYARDHVIGYGNKTYDATVVSDQEKGLKVIAYDLPQKDDSGVPLLKKHEVEADLIIQDIVAKVKNKFQVVDKDTRALRDVTYRDFTILCSAKSSFSDIEARFIRAGVPIFINDDELIVDDKVVIAFNAMLKILDAYSHEEQPTSYEFRFAAASFLRSFINNYSDQALFDLFGHRNRDFSRDPVLMKIKGLAFDLKTEPVSYVIKRLLEEFSFFAAVNRIGGVTQNTYKILNQIESIEKLEELDFSLTEIIAYFESVKSLDLPTKIVRPKLLEDSVTIMTIHKSKGLEFPIVYYMDNERGFYKVYSQSRGVSVDPYYGFLLRLNGKNETLPSLLADYKVKQTMLSERIRLLYVALTRAKELMIIIHRNDEKPQELKPLRDLNNFRKVLDYTKHYREAKVPTEVIPPLALVRKTITTYSGDRKLVLKPFNYNFPQKARPALPAVITPVSEVILARGTLLHKYIEIYDFMTKKLDYIPNKFDKEHLKSLFALPFFVNATTENVYREYDFLDEETNKTYVIDMFILGAREITLLDFKLVNLSEAKYDEQLNNYAKHLRKVFKRPVNAYLISIINLDYRKVPLHDE